MALVLADRVLETTTTTGSGTITLAGAEPGYQSFSVVGNANQTYYTITGDTEWEVGIGTYTSSGTTLSRDTVLSSSAGGAKVTLSAGQKKVFVTYPSEKSVNRDVSGNISVSSAIITNVAEPVTGSDAATKLYVDSLVAAGITYHSPVKYEVPNTTGNLTATYNNGTAGVSATLTNAGSLVPFIPDGVTASISDRVLVYSQTNQFENGVYVVSTVGDGSTAWVLTRATDADTYGLKSPNALGSGDAFFVTSGNTGAGETYVCNTSGVISFGSTAITFAQISSAQVYQAGNGISITNSTISLVTPVSVANGGTGQSTAPSNGQLLIGNGVSFVLSTLTAGSGVSITNSAGSITLSATGLGGTVTAVTASGPLASSGGTTPNISVANSTGTGSVVLDQGATISSATITAAVSASITTITGTSANITTVTGTTAGFSSAAITQLSGTSAGITTVSGTTTTFSSGTITQFGATSATIATVSGTNVTYSNGNLTSATVTTVSGTNLSYGSATITTGNLAFTGTAQRITGDMSNATIANRLAFQTSTTNGNTTVHVLPNGTATISAFRAFNNSDPTNASYAMLYADSTTVRFDSTITGTGTYLPMTFFTGGSERVRIDTSGNVGIGKTPTTILDVSGTITGTTVSATTGTFTSGTVTNLNSTSANITTLTGTTATYTSATVTNLNSTSANITTLTGTTFGTTATTQLRGASGQITTLTATSSNITTLSGTTATYTSATVTNLNSTSANITTLTGTTFGTTATTQLRGASAQITTISATTIGSTTGTTVNASTVNVTTTGTTINSNGDIYAIRAGGTTGVIFFGNSGTRYLFFDGSNYQLPTNDLYIKGVQAVVNSGTWSINVTGSSGSTTGNAATVTDGMYLASTQTSGGRKAFSASQNVGTMLTATGSLGGLEAINSSGANAAFMSFHRQGAYASYFGIDTDNQFAVGGWSAGAALANFKCNSLGVGTAASGTAGEIRATNNITAYYSDARLKDFKGKIGDALYKVSQLNGYYYTENEKAEEFGFNNKELQVGVSAQEVKAILPEVIAPAPFDMDAENKSKSGEDYMTVRYEKLVPLLIEAIKELKAEVEALKAAK